MTAAAVIRDVYPDKEVQRFHEWAEAGTGDGQDLDTSNTESTTIPNVAFHQDILLPCSINPSCNKIYHPLLCSLPSCHIRYIMYRAYKHQY